MMIITNRKGQAKSPCYNCGRDDSYMSLFGFPCVEGFPWICELCLFNMITNQSLGHPDGFEVEARDRMDRWENTVERSNLFVVAVIAGVVALLCAAIAKMVWGE
jgi:hypothetical protein